MTHAKLCLQSTVYRSFLIACFAILMTSCSHPPRGPSNHRCRKPAKFKLNPAATPVAVAIRGRAARRATRFMMITACLNVPAAICVIPVIRACACRPAIMAVRKDMSRCRCRVARRAITEICAIRKNACRTAAPQIPDNCPEGLSYSEETGRCSPDCPEGTYLAENGLCRSYYDQACPDGYQRNERTGRVCPAAIGRMTTGGFACHRARKASRVTSITPRAACRRRKPAPTALRISASNACRFASRARRAMLTAIACRRVARMAAIRTCAGFAARRHVRKAMKTIRGKCYAALPAGPSPQSQ